jgi:hypothetical protein
MTLPETLNTSAIEKSKLELAEKELHSLVDVDLDSRILAISKVLMVDVYKRPMIRAS